MKKFESSRSNSLLFGFMIFSFVLINYLFGSFLLIIVEESISKTVSAILLSMNQILFFLLPALILTRFSYIPFKEIYRINMPNSPKFWLLGIVFWAVITVFTLGFTNLQIALLPEDALADYFSLLESIYEKYSEVFMLDTKFGILKAIAIGALVPAFAEELVFRGAIQKHFETKKGIVFAGIVSAFLFSIIHFNPIHLASIFLIGFAASYLTFYSGSIYPAIFMHFLNNLVSIVALYFLEKDGQTYGTIFQNNNMSALVASIWTFIGIIGFIIVLRLTKYQKSASI